MDPPLSFEATTVTSFPMKTATTMEDIPIHEPTRIETFFKTVGAIWIAVQVKNPNPQDGVVAVPVTAIVIVIVTKRKALN